MKSAPMDASRQRYLFLVSQNRANFRVFFRAHEHSEPSSSEILQKISARVSA